MQPTLDDAHHSKPDMSSNKLYATCSQAQWRDLFSGKVRICGPRFANSHVGTKSVAAQLREEKEAVNERDGETNKGHQRTHLVPSVPSTVNGVFAQPSQLELVGPSIACAPYPYTGSSCVGKTPTHGPQPLVHPHSLGVHTTQMVLPLEIAEEPVYVNAKQYHGILRRRRLRAKAELQKKLIKERKPYFHESRHLHAIRRARGCGGRFLTTKKLDTDTSSANTTTYKDTATSDLNNTLSPDSNSASNGKKHYSQVQGFDLEGDFSAQKSKSLNLTGVGRVVTIK